MIIYKYEFDPACEPATSVECDWDDKVILLGRQSSGIIAFWMAHSMNPYTIKKRRFFRIVGTGQSINGEHRASFIDGAYVWHLIET